LFGTNIDDDDNPIYDSCQILENDSKQRGRYRLSIALDDAQKRTVYHKWQYRFKNIPGKFVPNPMLGKILSDYPLQYSDQYNQPFRSLIEYECFTSIKMDGVIYKADPDWQGKGYHGMIGLLPVFQAHPHRRTVQLIGG
jgi:hypothetical protein